MNNDDQENRDSLTEGDSDKQLGFETNEFATQDSPSDARRQSFDAFDSDQATEYDDLEAEDFGTEYIDDSADFDSEDSSFTDEPDDEDGPLDIWQQPADTGARVAGTSAVGTNNSRAEAADDDGVDLWGDTDSKADDYDDTADSPDWAAREETVADWSNEAASQQEWQEYDADPEEADWDNEEIEADLEPDDEPDDDIETSESWQTALDSDEWDDDAVEQSSGFFQSWPVGLIAVAVVALLLLAGGGYGVMQQRAEMQEEIRDLRAQLATAARPQQVTDSRDAQRELSEINTQLQGQLDSLALDNRQLSDTVAGLEGQLEGQRQAAIKLEEARAAARRKAATGTASSAPAVTVAPKTVSKPATTTAAVSGSSTWFVNFGSYSQQSVASDWATKLEPLYGKVIVAPASANGKTVYRVRVVDLPSKAEANSVSSRLQQEYKLPTLWVGRQ